VNTAAMLASPDLLGALPRFRDLSTYGRWIAAIKAIEGDPLSPQELEWFREMSMLDHPRPAGYREAVILSGVQSGKSVIASALAASAALRGQRGETALLMAQDARSSMRTILAYVREIFETVPAFQAEVIRATADLVELRNGCTLAAYPASPASARGLRCSIVVLDEFAFVLSTDGRPQDREVWRVARGRIAMTSGRVIVISTPFGESGMLHELVKAHYGRDSDTLVLRATAPQFNPCLPLDYLERLEREDPIAFMSEALGQFRPGVAALFDPAVLEECVDRGRHESLPQPGVAYAFAFDASGGRHDAASLAGGHREDEMVIVDVVRRWVAPHNPEAVIAEAARILLDFGVTTVQVDRFAAEFPIVAFARHGVTATVAAKTTSEHYLETLPRVNAGAVRLPDVAVLIAELNGLYRRSAGGRDRVDHRGAGTHDDTAASAAAVISMLSYRTPVPFCPVDDVNQSRTELGLEGPAFGFDPGAGSDDEDDQGDGPRGIWATSRAMAEGVAGGMRSSVNDGRRGASSWRRYGGR
jgi:hypothetical protein